MSPFSVKNWEDAPATTTPITAAALEDLETRVTNYTEAVKTDVAVLKEAPLNAESWSTTAADLLSVDNTQAANTTAWTAIINALPTAGGEILLNRGTYLGAITVSKNGIKIKGQGRNATQIEVDTGNLITFGDASTDVIYFGLEGLTALVDLNASGGHIFAPGRGVGLSSIIDCKLKQSNAGKSIWRQNGGYLIDLLVDNCEMEHVATATVPAWHLTGISNTNDVINSNTWRRSRCTYSGAYFFHIEHTTTGTYAFDNVFRDLTMEIPNGGNIKLLGCNNTLIEEVNTYDLSGATTQDLFFLGKHASGNRTYNTRIKNCARRGGSLGVGKKDIKVDDAFFTIIDQCSVSAGSVTFDLGGNPYCTLIGIDDGATIEQLGANTVHWSGWGMAELRESGDPGAPSANGARLYAKDLSGKTMLAYQDSARVALLPGSLTGTATWDPGSVADAAMTSTTVTVTGAAIGDPVKVGFSTAVPAGGVLVGSVTAADTVTVTLFNKTGGALDLASGTLRAVVEKFT